MSDQEQANIGGGEVVAGAQSFDVRKFEEAVALREKIRIAEAEIREDKKELAALEEYILEAFATTGMDGGTFSGTTVYPYRDIRASAKAGRMDDLCEVMYRMGYEDIVKRTIHANTLTSIVRSMIEDDGEEELPPELEDVLNVIMRYKVGYRKR